MASNSTSLALAWPREPYWELDGFDFSESQEARYPSRNHYPVLYKREFTGTSLPDNLRNRPSAAQYSVLVCNNVAILFRAMLYCKDSWRSSKFWDRVQSCTHGQGARLAKTVADIFVEARNVYLWNNRTCPNGAARLVDEWVSFLESGARPFDPTPWDLRHKRWLMMKETGDLKDTGYTSAPQCRTSSVLQSSHIGAHRQPTDTARAPTTPSSGALVIWDPDAAGVDLDTSPSVEVDSAQRSTSTRNRKEQESESRGSSPSPCKRKRQRSESRGSSSSKRRAKRLTRDAASRNSTERYGSMFPLSDNTGVRRTTKTRFADCEKQLAEQTDLIHAQDSRLAGHDELVANHTTKLEDLDSRVKSVESKPSGRKKIRVIQESLVKITDRLNNRNSYIRCEIKKQLNEALSPLDEEQKRLSARLDAVHDDSTLHKVRTEEAFEKAINKQEEKLTTLESNLKLKRRTQRRQFIDLSKRVAGLEEKGNGDNEPTLSKDDKSDDNYVSPAEPSMAHVIARMTQLENIVKEKTEEIAKQQEALDTLKIEMFYLKSTSDASHEFQQWQNDNQVHWLPLPSQHQDQTPSPQIRACGLAPRPASVRPPAVAQTSLLASRPAPILAGYQYSQHQSRQHQGDYR